MKLRSILIAICSLPLTLMSQNAELTEDMIKIPPFPDEWKLIEIKPPESEEIWMFRKNIGVSKIKGLKTLPTLVYFTIQFTPKDSSGLPNLKDTKVLYDFEEDIIPKVEAKANSVCVASVIKGGIKDHLFYVSDPNLFIDCLNEHRKALNGFKISLEKHEDPKWKIYDDFPSGE